MNLFILLIFHYYKWVMHFLWETTLFSDIGYAFQPANYLFYNWIL